MMFRELSDMEFADLDPEKRQEYLLGQTLNHQAQTAKWMKIFGVIVLSLAILYVLGFVVGLIAGLGG